MAEVAQAPMEPVAPAAAAVGGERAAALVELMGAHRQLRGAATNLNQATTALNATGQAPEALSAIAEYVRRGARRVDDAVVALAAARR